MLVCLGPFSSFGATGRKRTAFATSPRALVPHYSVHLDNSRIYAIYAAGSGYYVIYETENVDFYRPYLAPVPPPEARKSIDKIKAPMCPDCGSLDVIVDSDEMYCRKCDIEFWYYGVVWEPKPFDPAQVVQGAGIYVVEGAVENEYSSAAGHRRVVEVKVLEESEEVLGNVAAKVKRFIGYVHESHWDESPTAHSFAVYERVNALNISFTRRLRPLDPEELYSIIPLLPTDVEVLEGVLSQLPEQRAREAVKAFQLYKHLPWHVLRNWADEEVRKLYAEHICSLIRERMLKRQPVDHLIAALREVDPANPIIPEALQYQREIEEEQRRRWEKRERKWREERERGLREKAEQLRSALQGLAAVAVEGDRVVVKLKKRVSKEEFERYVKTCRELGLRFDPQSKAWVWP